MKHNRENITQYREYIQDLARDKKNVVFYNSGPDHAALVMATIFNNADHVKIYAGNFSGDISNKIEYRTSINNFLSRGGKLDILLQKDKLGKTEPKIFDILRFYSVISPQNIKIKKHSTIVFRKVDTEGENHDLKELHFTVGDKKMYRVEDNVELFTAYGNFNDSVHSQTLTTLFDEIFNDETKSEIIDFGKPVNKK